MATYTVKGESFESKLSTVEALGVLAKIKSDFAASLLDQSQRKRGLSSKQLAWVHKLAHDFTNRQDKTADLGGSFEKISALFMAAKEHLKFPKVRLQTSTGRNIVLKLAGNRSRYTGDIHVCDEDEGYYGRIQAKDGSLVTRNTPEDVVQILRIFAEAPAETAAAYGRLLGNCCFCGRPLEDEKSTAVGYGPVCAKHYRLPWGAKAAEATGV